MHIRRPGLFELGRTVGFPDNGSVTRVAISPASLRRTARLVRSRGYDLVHLHEPMLPNACFTALHAARVPVVGTFHMLNVSDRRYRLFGPVIRRAATKLSARIAVSCSRVSLRARARYRGAADSLCRVGQREACADSVRRSGKRTRNVPAGMLEDAEPIPVASAGAFFSDWVDTLRTGKGEKEGS